MTSLSAVRYQMKLHAATLKAGDVLMSNSPQAGGSSVHNIVLPPLKSNLFPRHLPDITIITPVFDKQSNKIIFFTASRGHHADIGGILPGSMPPTSTTIFEEGANVESFKIVSDGIFDKKGLDRHMIEIPASYPGSSGCRNIRDVESDLKAVRSLPEYVILQLICSTANCGEP
jgi:5-oxoprolinase (ATP-hydrolysing)